MESKTHWKKFFNPDYLGAYSLDPGEERVLTIKTVKYESIKGPDGKSEELPVCYFTSGKPMVLNVTNSKTIAKMIGSNFVEDWAGHNIQIGVAQVRAFGEIVEAIRVRPVKPKKEKLDADRFDKMITAIKAGKYQKADAIDRFDLTPEQSKKINAA